MLKSVFAAHLTEQDNKDLTILINDRSFGSFSRENKSNFVLTSNREVHMVCSFSNKSLYYDPRFNKDRIRLWNQSFREMQSHGIKAFPQFIHDHHIYAENLYIFTSDIFIGWQDRRNGLYLLRKGTIYRLQPTVLPANVFDSEWMNHTDFYSFSLHAEDVVFSISDKLFDRMDPAKAEELFQEKKKLSNVMNELIAQLRIYNEEFDLSWFGFEVERIDKNTFNTEFNERRQSKNDFTRLINSSRVSKVKDGQKLIIAPKNLQSKKSDRIKPEPTIDFVLNHPAKTPGHVGSDHSRGSANRQKNKYNSLERRKNLEQLENQRSERDVLMDDIRSFSFEPILNNLKRTIGNLFNLIPEKPILSKILSGSIILLLIVFIFLVGRAIGSRSGNDAPAETKEPAFETRKMEVNESVVAPEGALLEIEITVKANNLQIRQEPNSESAIVATVQRGAKVTQLAEPDNNWVFVRLSDGHTVGYAFADSLFAEE